MAPPIRGTSTEEQANHRQARATRHHLSTPRPEHLERQLHPDDNSADSRPGPAPGNRQRSTSAPGTNTGALDDTVGGDLEGQQANRLTAHRPRTGPPTRQTPNLGGWNRPARSALVTPGGRGVGLCISGVRCVGGWGEGVGTDIGCAPGWWGAYVAVAFESLLPDGGWLGACVTRGADRRVDSGSTSFTEFAARGLPLRRVLESVLRRVVCRRWSPGHPISVLSYGGCGPGGPFPPTESSLIGMPKSVFRNDVRTTELRQRGNPGTHEHREPHPTGTAEPARGGNHPRTLTPARPACPGGPTSLTPTTHLPVTPEMHNPHRDQWAILGTSASAVPRHTRTPETTNTDTPEHRQFLHPRTPATPNFGSPESHQPHPHHRPVPTPGNPEHQDTKGTDAPNFRTHQQPQLTTHVNHQGTPPADPPVRSHPNHPSPTQGATPQLQRPQAEQQGKQPVGATTHPTTPKPREETNQVRAVRRARSECKAARRRGPPGPRPTAASTSDRDHGPAPPPTT